jgi:cytochrome c-type biogenesis protein CcmH/NrfG
VKTFRPASFWAFTSLRATRRRPSLVGAYRQAIRLDPSLQGVRLDLAIQLLTHSSDPNAWKEGLGELKEELKINPSSAEAHYEIGEIYRKHGEPQEASAAFQHALELRPNFVEARIGLAKVFRQQGHMQQAAAILEPVRKASSDNAALHFLLAQIYRDLGRVAEAQQEERAFKQIQATP